ncbi:MAG: cytochrome c biogenesis protein DipZ [Actinomycetota bacterium]|nr:cytochrome c biogenesis protein DipZ [Actinomycetota bacterium]
MIVLLAFAFLAGAATAITPCVLPVLPALLSASATGGRRRPLGIVTGLAITFTITIVGVATVVDGVGVADETLRTVAICCLVLFGITLLLPSAGQRLEARLAWLSRFGPRSAGSGFWSGLPVGGALGFVYAPCAGPILGAVISVSISRGTTAELVTVAVAYALGSALTLLLLGLGGRRVLDGVRRAGRGPALQQAFGAVMVITAVLMLAELDIRFQSAIADKLPSFLTNPTRALERSDAVEGRLADLRGKPRFDSSREMRVGAEPRRAAETKRVAHRVALAGVKTPALPRLGPAPDFSKPGSWFNAKPLSIQALRGRVTLIDFWTYTCINCLRTLPYLKAWNDRYAHRGLTIVGVHTPEFAFERKASNVRDAIAREGLRYPVVQDNEFGTWNAYGNQYWPAKYLIDAKGQVRYTHFGEGDYKETEAAIRTLLAEAGTRDVGAAAAPGRQPATAGRYATPETYLGSARARSFSPVGPRDGTHDYTPSSPGRLARDTLTLGGRWAVDRESARAVRGATLSARVFGRSVYLVMSSRANRPRRVRVLLDGGPIPRAVAGDDVTGATVTVRRQRLYRLVSLDRVEEHVLTLRVPPGVSGYAFTFG